MRGNHSPQSGIEDGLLYPSIYGPGIETLSLKQDTAKGAVCSKLKTRKTTFQLAQVDDKVVRPE